MKNDHNPTCGPSLSHHLSEMQTKATRLNGLIEAINYLEIEGDCESGRVAICAVAESLARELTDGLDSVNLPSA